MAVESERGSRPRSRDAVSAIILASAVFMVFSAAAIATSEPLRVFLIVDGIVLSLGLLFLFARRFYRWRSK